MKAPVKSSSAETRERLLTAAARVFARDGLTGATTRAIADAAGVNEVTLFRHFRTKQRLLAAVVHENFSAPDGARPNSPLPTTADLAEDLRAHARRYELLLQENLPLIRTMIGEIHHHGQHERQVYHAIFQPLRDELIARLEKARTERQLRAGVDPVVLSDLFGGMIFTGVLRRASTHARREYPAAAYLDLAVELVVRGAAG